MFINSVRYMFINFSHIFISLIINIYHKYPKFIIYFLKYITIYYKFINKLNDSIICVLFTESELTPFLLYTSAYASDAWM